MCVGSCIRDRGVILSEATEQFRCLRIHLDPIDHLLNHKHSLVQTHIMDANQLRTKRCTSISIYGHHSVGLATLLVAYQDETQKVEFYKYQTVLLGETRVATSNGLR